MAKKHWSEWIWDAWCIASVIGIWPRFIEPRMLMIKRLTLSLPQFPIPLHGVKLLHFSDLHWGPHLSVRYLKKMISRINSLKPDLILFSGDFLCRSKLDNPEGLKNFLSSLQASNGCYAVLGNHDYTEFVTVSGEGDYDVEKQSAHSTIVKGFKRLFRSAPLTRKITDQAQQVKRHRELVHLLEQTPFQVLNNTTKVIPYNSYWINICGLEDYTCGKFLPSKAFENYKKEYPGIVLSHNPDTLEVLRHYPGDLVLCGHTHGGQVNFPWLWKRFTRLENGEYKRGLKDLGQKWAYINRGISSIMKFRWFAPPELTLITLRGSK